MKRLQIHLKEHQLFYLIFFLFFVFRLLAILLFRPGGFITDASDYDFYMVWGELTPQGYRAYDNLWTAYPPLFPLVMLPVFELSSQIPPWIEPRFFFHTLFGATLLLFELGNLVLIYRIALKLEKESTDHQRPIINRQLPAPLFSILLYSLLFTPVYTLLGWFEPMPLFFMLLGLDLLLQHTGSEASVSGWVLSAVAAALGFLTKLTPILLLPIAIRWLGSKLSWTAAKDEWFQPSHKGNLLRPVIYTVLFVVVVVGVGYPVVRHNPSLALSSFQIQGLRPPWQSLWALIDGFHGYGLVPIDMRNLVALETRTWDSRIPWTAISVAFVGIWLWLYTRRYDWNQVRTPLAFAAVSVIALFLYSKGWSPQFLVWVLAFVVLLLPTWRGMAIASALAILNAIESHIFLVLLPSETWILWYTVVVRTILLILLVLEFISQIWPDRPNALRMATVSRTVSWAVLFLALIALPAGLPRGVQAYEERRLAEHACPDIISYLQSESIWPNRQIIGEQVSAWREFSPWLRSEYRFHIVDVYSPVDEPSQEVALRKLNEIAGNGEFWWLTQSGAATTAGQSSSADTFFRQPEVYVLDRQEQDSCQLSRVMRVPESPKAILGTESSIVLHEASWQANSVGNSLHLVLYWQAQGPVQESYTVFTQLFDSNGTLVAQKDNLPVEGLAPTNTWDPQKVIRDPYQLTTQGELIPGSYQLHIGMYREGERVSITDEDGKNSDSIELSIEIR